MTKQKKIKEAWGEYWDKVKDHVSEFGWCTMINSEGEFVSPTFLQLGMTREFTEENFDYGYYEISRIHRWRPKSLQGIEDNNGWLKIEKAEDIPKEKVLCYYSGFNVNTNEFYVSELSERDTTRLQNLFESKYLTHIMIVEPFVKPNPPHF